MIGLDPTSHGGKNDDGICLSYRCVELLQVLNVLIIDIYIDIPLQLSILKQLTLERGELLRQVAQCLAHRAAIDLNFLRSAGLLPKHRRNTYITHFLHSYGSSLLGPALTTAILPAAA